MLRCVTTSQSARRSVAETRVPGHRSNGRGRRSRKRRPVTVATAGSVASQTVVSTPSAGLRRIGPHQGAKPGSEAEMPGVSAQPGCIALKVTSAAGILRAHSRIRQTCARFAAAYARVPW